MTRNLLFFRSLIFGTAAKAVGGLLVFAGLPIIASTLPAREYALFLKGMSASAFTTLLFGAATTLSVRTLAEALAGGSACQIANARKETATLYVLVFLTTATATGLVIPFAGITSRSAAWIMVPVGLALFQGILAWGDSYRLASRTDHLSSTFQIAGTLLILFLLLEFSREGLGVVIGIYFGVPVLVQAAVLAHLAWQHSIKISLAWNFVSIRAQLGGLTPIVIYSASEYCKIFGSGIVLSIVIGDSGYALYTTIVLFVARLVNPISLISRPLMPALIDAMKRGDHGWLKKSSFIFAILEGVSFLLLLIVALVVPHGAIWLIPSKLGQIARSEMVCAALFLWGYGMSALLAPFYFSIDKARQLASVNAGFVALGILAGALSAHRYGAGAMLACVAGASCLTALVLTVLAARHLRDQYANNRPNVHVGLRMQGS